MAQFLADKKNEWQVVPLAFEAEVPISQPGHHLKTEKNLFQLQ